MLPFGGVGGKFELAEVGLGGGSEAESGLLVTGGAGGKAVLDLGSDSGVKATAVG